MIYCVWYPTGGFGHYINSVLSLYGDNFVRPNNKHSFGIDGNSHQLDLVLPACFKHEWTYDLSLIDSNRNYSVLVDNGITDESEIFVNYFKNSKIIKICYDDYSWPILAKTYIVKGMRDTIENRILVGHQWPDCSPWATREKYFLYLLEHPLRHAWRPTSQYNSLKINVLLNYNEFKHSLAKMEITCSNFKELHNTMLKKNQQYFSSVTNAVGIINALQNNQHMDISHIVDLWDQAVINYFIKIEFDFEVPANTYANWFTNTKEILKLL